MSPEAGDTFAGHRIEAVAGRGGMGVVYRARDLSLDRVVALKLIAPEYAADAEFRERFKRESRLAASLQHPNVVPIYGAGEEDGLLFVTMAFIEGTDLRTLVKAGRLAPERACAILDQVASALDAAHAAGLIHRDVKPANVLIADAPKGEHAYLTDFGLTKQSGSETKMTQTGTFVGTLDYIAPEQLEGGAVDARADVYALGCVLYEMLTGEVPFPRSVDTAKMWAHVGEPPPTPTHTAPGIPERFDTVIARAMAKDPAERYPSAGDLARAAQAAAEDREPESAEQSVARGRAAPGGEARAEKRRRRARPVPIAIAGGLIAAAAAAGTVVLGGGGSDEPTCGFPGGLGSKQKPVRIYSSLPLQSAAGKATQAIVTGAKMALAEAKSRSGGCVVAYRPLDSSTVSSEGGSDPKRVAANAGRAAEDKSALAYIGEWESGATAESLPILNRAGLAMVSPSNTSVGLTRAGPGSLRGEPAKYYPAKRRTYLRLIPTAIAQAAVMPVVMRQQQNCSDLFVVVDPSDPYTAGVASIVKKLSKSVGMSISGEQELTEARSSVDRIVADIRNRQPDCILVSVLPNEDTSELLTDLNKAAPSALLLGGDTIAFDELGVDMTNAARSRTRILNVPLPRGAFPPAGLAFFRRLLATYGSEVYDPFAAYGYEAMKLVLDAVETASEGGGDRAAVVKALFATRNRPSVLGTYSIDKNGDTSLSDHGLFRPASSKLQFDRVVRASPALLAEAGS